MPTYGMPETAKDFPPSDELLQLRIKIAAEKARANEVLNPLQQKLDIMQSYCDHHFVPERDATRGWQESLVSAVFRAGSIPEAFEKCNDLRFRFTCSHCGMTETTDVCKHCPWCGQKTKGHFGNSSECQRYFGDHDFGYNGLWLIECTSLGCNFKAVGLRWDQ